MNLLEISFVRLQGFEPWTLIKSQMLYQLSYKRICIWHFSNASAKVRIIFQTAKRFSKYFRCFSVLFQVFECGGFMLIV